MWDPWAQQLAGPAVFLAVILVLAASNLRALRRVQSFGRPAAFPRVSLLVPARNEARNIETCVRSLLEQDYPDFELLVLDDESSDGTGAILARIAAGDARLRVLRGKPLPAGWLGKHWACSQLAAAAGGELLLFTDADTRHHPCALSDALAAQQALGADLLAGLPHQDVGAPGEGLVVPIITFSVFCFLPLAIAHRLSWPPLSAAIGQFMLFRRAAYERVGGHAAVRLHAADDLALGRRVIAMGMRWRLVDAGRRVDTRMYRNFAEVWQGLGRTLFAGFDYHAWLFVPIWLWLAVVFLEPPLVLLLALAGWPVPAAALPVAAAAVLAALALWALFVLRFDAPRYLVLLYPVAVAITVAIALRSLFVTRRGRTAWKGRAMPSGDRA